MSTVARVNASAIPPTTFLPKQPNPTFRSICMARAEPGGQTKATPIMQIADLVLYLMVKGGYDRSYRPNVALMKNNRLIDALLAPEERASLGMNTAASSAYITKARTSRAFANFRLALGANPGWVADRKISTFSTGSMSPAGDTQRRPPR